MSDSHTLPVAAGLGAIAGMRTFSAPLALARAVRASHLDLSGTPIAFLGSAKGAHGLAALALGELIADKLPFIPSRTETPGLVGRFFSGALAGGSIARARKTSWISAALVGGAAAIVVSFAAQELRRRAVERTHLPDPVIALVEDAIVIGSGLALAAKLKRYPSSPKRRPVTR